MVAVGVHQKLPNGTIDVESAIPLRPPQYTENPPQYSHQQLPQYNELPTTHIYTSNSQYNGAELNRASYAPSEASSETNQDEDEKQSDDDSVKVVFIIVGTIVVLGIIYLVVSYSDNGVSSGGSSYHNYGHGGSNYMIFHSSHSSSHRSSYHGSSSGGRRGGSRGGSRGGGGRRG